MGRIFCIVSDGLGRSVIRFRNFFPEKLSVEDHTKPMKVKMWEIKFRHFLGREEALNENIKNVWPFCGSLFVGVEVYCERRSGLFREVEHF